MDPSVSLPALPFTVGADRAGARRRWQLARVAFVLDAAVFGVAVGVGFAALVGGPGVLALVCGIVALVTLVSGLALRPALRRPPEDDWLFRLEPDGLRLPPGRRAPAGHPGLVVPWPLLAAVTPRLASGDPVAVLVVAPPGEQVLLGQGSAPAQARLAVQRGLRLRLSHGAVAPAECVRLIVATRAARLAG